MSQIEKAFRLDGFYHDPLVAKGFENILVSSSDRRPKGLQNGLEYGSSISIPVLLVARYCYIVQLQTRHVLLALDGFVHFDNVHDDGEQSSTQRQGQESIGRHVPRVGPQQPQVRGLYQEHGHGVVPPLDRGLEGPQAEGKERREEVEQQSLLQHNQCN